MRPDQKDIDSLPPYDVLDAILEDYVEDLHTAEQIAADRNFDLALVRRVIRMVDGSGIQAPAGRSRTQDFFQGFRLRPPLSHRRQDDGMTMVLTCRESRFRKELMRRSLLCCLFIVLPLSLAVAQQKPSAKSKDALPPAPTFSTRLPSEETVNAFMKQMFGYDPAVSWKIAAIRPSQAEGLSEVLVVLSNAQGQQNNRLYVTEDGQHAVIGDIIPFGAHPFAAAQEALTREWTAPREVRQTLP